jgi:CRP-like cAMP-binding protein
LLQPGLFYLFWEKLFKMFEQLVKIPIFKGVESGKLESLLSSIPHQVKRYSRNEMIAYADDEVSSLLFVLEGSVKGEMVDFSGKTIKIEDIESPRPLAPAFLFGKNNRYPVNIVANNDVVILSLPKQSLIRLLQQNELVLSNFLDNISNRAQFLSNKIKFLSFQTIKGKIAHFILKEMQKTGLSHVHLPVTQSDLAELFGVARPSVGRAIKEMDRDGLISSKGSDIEILSRDRLSALLKQV